jgi:NAD-dependent SIR2 family protein deacetylase
MSNCRGVEYVRCVHCNKMVNVWFAHGAIQVKGCIDCYRPKMRPLKWLFKLLKRI